MSLTDKLKSLQEKPEAIRRKFAFTAALALTAIIFFIWVVNFSFGIRKESAQVEARSTPSPLSVLAGQFHLFFGEIKGGIASIRNAIK